MKYRKRWSTPVFSILAIAAVGLIAMFMDVATSTSFINFGAFIAFIMVNVSVIVYWVRQRHGGKKLNALLYALCPAIGVLVIAFLLTQLDAHAVAIGSIWLVIGAVILGFTTRGFKSQPSQMALEGIDGAS